MAVSKPTLTYFPLKGRGELIRLTLAAKAVDFDEVVPDMAAVKQDLAGYPFGQVPRWEQRLKF